MSKNNKFEFRCSNIVKKKNEKEDRCSRFLLEYNSKTDTITVRCSNCGTVYIFSKGFDGKLKAVGIPKEKALLKSDKKE